MNRFVPVFLLLCNNLSSQDIVNSELGFSMTLNTNWRSVPVSQATSAVEASRNNSKGDFFLFYVQPSGSLPASVDNLNDWAISLTTGSGGSSKDILKSQIVKLSNGNWYYVQYKVSDLTCYSYIQTRNGYSYAISFLRKYSDAKEFEPEIVEMINSLKFESPLSIVYNIACFDSLYNDDSSKMKIPKGYHFQSTIDTKEVPPFVLSTYKIALTQKSGDLVLVGHSSSQLFGLHIRQTPSEISLPIVKIVSKIVGSKFEKDGDKYEELKADSWDRAPEKIFINKFRVTKKDEQLTHYIFYIKRGSKLYDYVKFVTPSIFETVLEPCFYKFLEANM